MRRGKNYITKVIIFYEILLLFSLLRCAFIYYALPVNSRLRNSQKNVKLEHNCAFLNHTDYFPGRLNWHSVANDSPPLRRFFGAV